MMSTEISPIIRFLYSKLLKKSPEKGLFSFLCTIMKKTATDKKSPHVP